MLRRLRIDYGNLSIRAKMMISFMLVVFLIVFTLSVLNTSVLTRSLTQVTNDHIYQIIEQVKVRIENYTSSMAKIQSFIAEDKVLKHYINTDESNEKQQLEESVEAVLSLYADLEPNINGILFISNEDVLISPNIERIEDVSLTEEPWYKQAFQNPDSIHLVSQPIGRNIRSIYEYNHADNIISLTKAVKDDKGIVKGVILIDMNLDVIEKIINSVTLGKNGFLYVASNGGDVIFSPVNKIVYRISNDAIIGGLDFKVGREVYQIVKSAETSNQWTVMGVFSKNETLTVITEVILVFIFYAMIIIVIAILFADFLTKSLTKPISKLRFLMAKAEEGELDLAFDYPYSDEIGKLGGSFNQMMKSIQSLIDEVHVAHKNKREAEIRAFQAQIKPHFLYNTLDTINWMAQEYDADDISEMITSLTDLFRISLSKGNEIITLENELKHVKSYLTIQMVRYEDQFDYVIKVDSSLIGLKVIKLIVQPLVENAIYHGIKESKRKGHIRIEATQDNDRLLLMVSDNGLGIEPIRLRELNKVLSGESEKPDTIGIGIFNVNERLKLNFGENFGLTIWSEVGKGTTVTLTHPILSEETAEDICIN